MKKIWGHKLPNAAELRREGQTGNSGFGGSLAASSKRDKKLGRELGQVSLFLMAFVTPTLSYLLHAEVSNTLLFTFLGLGIVISHILLFVCDTLTAGDGKEAGWALIVFWMGVPLTSILLYFLS